MRSRPNLLWQELGRSAEGSRRNLLRLKGLAVPLVVRGLALSTASTGPTLGQDAAAGEQVFKQLCSPCHEIGRDAKIKLGPPLNGIDGRKSGTFEGFNYSPANKSSGITWSEETSNGAPATLSGRTTRTHPRTSFPP